MQQDNNSVFKSDGANIENIAYSVKLYLLFSLEERVMGRMRGGDRVNAELRAGIAGTVERKT